MLVLKRLIALAVLVVSGLAGQGIALAASGQPVPWQIGLQEAVTPVMTDIVSFHHFLLIVITVITLFVLALLIVIVVKYNAGSNPVPSKTTHHTLLEVVWTVVPVMILALIAIPSFKLLFLQL